MITCAVDHLYPDVVESFQQRDCVAEAVFSVDDHEIVLEVSAEEDIIVAIMVDEETSWKGTLKGLTKLLSDAIRPKSA